MKKILFSFLIIFNLFAVWYLIIPLPQIPDLNYAIKSDLPGDTTQLQNVTGYFTNLSRTEVINFYKANIPGLFRIQLNHPPEKAKEIIKDTIQTYYLEEFVLPFKESVFINGYDWQKDVFTKPEKRIINKIIYHGIDYQSKITIKVFSTSIIQRFIGFFVTEISVLLIFYLFIKVPWKIKL